jgi:hypothetical protein
MTEDEFHAFMVRCWEEFEQKQEALISDWGLGSYATYVVDEASGIIEFRDESRKPQVVARMVPIGSYSHRGSWMWGWANPIFSAALRRGAEPIKELGALTGTAAFTQPGPFALHEMHTAQLTALAVQKLGAVGAYKCTGPNSTGVMIDLHLALMSLSRPGSA